jgi:hypothetical protein
LAGYDSQEWIDEYPGGQAPTGTGAPGSEGITAAQSFGPVVGTPIVSIPGVSSQLAEGRPTLAVQSGDTSAFSSDRPVNPGPLLPDWQGASETGAGAGRVHAPRPGGGQ